MNDSSYSAAVMAPAPSSRRASIFVAVLMLAIGGWMLASRPVSAQSASVTAQADVASPEVIDDEMLVETSADGTAWGRRETLLASLTIFALAVFLGFELITKVPPTLHTPLMSGSNAISGITLVGAILVVGVKSSGWLIPLLGSIAVITATVNAVGGFAVTHRMLAMFKRK